MFIDKKYFGIYLAKKRTKSGLSQTHLARKLGYSSGQFVSNWERGESAPPVDKLAELAESLRIPIEELVEFIIAETASYLQNQLLPKRKKKRRRA